MATLKINENNDLINYSQTNDTLNFTFIDEDKFNEVIEFEFKSGFNFLFYISDTLTPDITIGVKKWENCILFNIDKDRLSCSIEGNKEEFFNLSQKGKIRKFTIDGLLGE